MGESNERTLIDRLLAENDRLLQRVQALEDALRRAMRAAESLNALIYLDSLTGMPNRRWLDDNFRKILSGCKPHGQLAVLFVDLDDFKRVNDSVGHCTADGLLREVATTLDAVIRSNDILTLSLRFRGTRNTDPMLSRLGGDEFVILLPEVRHRAAAEAVARRILRRLSRPFQVDNRDVLVTASIGIAVYPSDGETTDTLIRNADAALYRAKRNGKARYECHC